MSKIEKQKQKLKDRIEMLETELKTSLHKKTTGPAINVGSYTSKIAQLRTELNKLA